MLDRPPVLAELDSFMEFFDPSLSMREQWRRLQRLSEN
jgi:hypothetical protein